MRIRWFSNACVLISSNSGGSILCDPWVNPGANLGSWFHWPPVPTDYEDILFGLELDGIFISHLHSDHYDPKFISKFTRLRPDVPILFPQFAHPWLKNSLSRVIYEKTELIEIPTLEEIHIGDGLTIKSFAADTCNPQVCNINVPCQSNQKLRGIDGIGVFRADNLLAVNANDAMGINLVPKVAANIGKADILMGHYGAASPFPQSFPKIKDKKAAIEKVVSQALKDLTLAAEALDARYIFPFAGQYLLGGRLHELNDFLAILPLDKTVEELRKMSNKTILSVEPFGTINLNDITAHKHYTEPASEMRQKYIQEIARVKFPYERTFSTSWENSEHDLIRAAKRVLNLSKSALLSFDNSFVIGDGTHCITINLYKRGNQSTISLGEFPTCPTVTRIKMPENLLRMLCNRRNEFIGFTPLHWNQADGGSHFTWEREGLFDLNAHLLLNFFGT